MTEPPVGARCPRCGGATVEWVTARDRHGTPPVTILRCTACGAGHTHAPPPHAPAAPTRLPACGPLRTLADRIIRAELKPVTDAVPAGRSVIDIGGGAGNRALQLHRLGYRVTLLEPDPAEAAAARAQLPAAVAIVDTTLDAAPAGRTAYDAALLSHVLEHLDDPGTALRQVRARLRPGGVLVAMVPNAGGLEARLLRGRWHGWEPSRHRRHHTAATLRRDLLDAGYADVAVTARGGWIHPAALAYSLAPGLDPQIATGPRAVAGRILTALLAPIALLEVLVGAGPQLVAIARAPEPGR